MHPTDVVQWLARARASGPSRWTSRWFASCSTGSTNSGWRPRPGRADQFPDLSPPRTVHRAACLDEGLRIEGLRGEPTHWVPWDRVEMICAGKVTAEDEFRDVHKHALAVRGCFGHPGSGLAKPVRWSRMARAIAIPRDPVGEILIVRRDPRIAFRVVENQMNYAYLGKRLHELGGRELPDLPRRPLRPGRPGLPDPLDPRPAGATATRRIMSSPRPRPSSTTPPIACSGAGIAATVRPRTGNRTRTARTRSRAHRDLLKAPRHAV